MLPLRWRPAEASWARAPRGGPPAGVARAPPEAPSEGNFENCGSTDLVMARPSPPSPEGHLASFI
eukprot:8883355-Pyramimonas_sp.AAC.1